MCRSVFTNPIRRRRHRWANNLDTTLCCGIPFPTRSNRCWRWGASAAAVFLSAIPGCAWLFFEGNCGWLPFLLWRLDEHWEMFGDQWAPELKNPPSYYFKRQCYASVEADEEPVKYAIDFLGNDRLVFSTDFPHVDTKYPKAVERFLQLPIGEEDKRKICGTTAPRTTGSQEDR